MPPKAEIKPKPRLKPKTKLVIEPIVPVQASETAEQPSVKKMKTSPTKKPEKFSIRQYAQTVNNTSVPTLLTQLVSAVSFLKDYKRPISIRELVDLSGVPLLSDPGLLQKFRTHDRIIHDKQTDLYSYKYDLCFESKLQLLTEIKRHSLATGHIPFKSIEEASINALAMVEQLEKEGEIIVLRNKKQIITHVFWDELPLNEQKGIISVDKDLRELWSELVTPADDSDLMKALEAQGIEAMKMEKPIVLKRPGKPKKGAKKKVVTFRGRIQNVHMKDKVDLTMDYVPSVKPSASG